MKGDLQVYRNINQMQAVGMHANLSDSKAAFRQKGGITHRTPVKMPKTCLLYTEGYQQ